MIIGTIGKMLAAHWPPAKRRAEEAEAAREKAAAEARQQAELAERKRREAEEQVQKAYDRHVKAVDLGYEGTRDTRALDADDLSAEVEKRIKLARAAGGDRCLVLADKMTDVEIAAVTGKLDEGLLYWLLEHKDPTRQRDAAKALLDARSKVQPYPDLYAYVTAVGEAAARVRGYKYSYNRIAPAIVARAILLRSASGKWDRTRKSGGVLPLSASR